MNPIIGIVMLVLAVFDGAFLVYMTQYVLGFRENNLIYVTGFLESTELQKNVFRGHPFSGKWHKHWTSYIYTYRIHGQQYKIYGGVSGQRKDVPMRVAVAVQKNAPKNAIIPQFEQVPSKWTLPVLLLGFVVLVAVGLCLAFL